MAFPLCLVSPEGFLLIPVGPQAFEIIADSVNLSMRGMTGFVFKGLPLLMKRPEKGRFQVMVNWSRETLLGRNHRILFGCFSLLFLVCMTTCLTV